MNPVPERPVLPTGATATIGGLTSWASALVRRLVEIFGAYGYRINKALPKDGTEAMDAPLPLASYVSAERPSAADNEGAVIYVSDASAGSKFQGSDGSSWVSLG